MNRELSEAAPEFPPYSERHHDGRALELITSPQEGVHETDSDGD